ncbi:MAG: bifunctional 5,10-methylenetetrahydrofolate dehydrogenase/5,10-methenyltetrahydrofolate cyclohydrolase [Actinomycetota bacterium]|nr:bifunctional 5,10-methylenetetrahydrofolate dehydrogenase/5,10-methenyltetrahydrofolate cyclohydrolase [Actinomycetota bacterium]
MPVVMAGGPVAEAVLAGVRTGVAELASSGRRVGLGTILAGDDPASEGYIRMKRAKAEELGIASSHVSLPATATQQQLVDAVRRFNDDPAVDAMLVQHPVPPGLDYDAALAEMDPDKDVDGLHPCNMGRVALGLEGPTPCTPAGIEAILQHYGVPVEGRDVVILGRGVTLGRPLALLLSQKRPGANAAVTVVHSSVDDWTTHTRRADVVVAAVGVPGILRAEHVRPGAAVVGGGVRYEGRKLLPDVDESVADVAGWITPRVGGVGPTTVAMLFRNALRAAQRRNGRH